MKSAPASRRGSESAAKMRSPSQSVNVLSGTSSTFLSSEVQASDILSSRNGRSGTQESVQRDRGLFDALKDRRASQTQGLMSGLLTPPVQIVAPWESSAMMLTATNVAANPSAVMHGLFSAISPSAPLVARDTAPPPAPVDGLMVIPPTETPQPPLIRSASGRRLSQAASSSISRATASDSSSRRVSEAMPPVPELSSTFSLHAASPPINATPPASARISLSAHVPGIPLTPLGNSITSMNNLTGNRKRRSSLSMSIEAIVVRTSIPGRPRNTVDQQRRALRNMKRFQRCVRILMNTFRWFALFDEYSLNVAQNGGRSALSAQQSMGSGAIIRKSASTASGGESSSSASANSGYINSAALFRPVLSDYAASRAMFAVPPALRHVLTQVPRNQRSESDIHLIFKYLENVSGFKSYSQSVIKELAAVVDHEVVRPGRVVLKQGHQPQSMYIIVRGTCDVFRTENLAPGRYWRRVLRPLAAGDLFGDIGVRTGAVRSASIVPTTECELLRIDKADYDSIIDRQVGVANQVKLQFLAQSPVGRHMTDEERQGLALLGIVHEYARGEVIVHEGKQVKHVLAVRSGTVRVVKYVEFWYQRIDILPHDAPIDGKSVVENLPVSRRTALATPKYMQWHRRPDNAHCYRQDRGDKIEGEFLVIGELHSGDFAEEQTIRITPQSPADIAKHQSLIRNVASRHVVDANAVFYAQSTYIADEPCEIIQFPNVEFLKVASDETLTAMQTIVNMRPSVDVQVNEYLKHRAYGKVKEKIVGEVLGRKDREQTEKFFAMETQHVRSSQGRVTGNGNRPSNSKAPLKPKTRSK